MKKSLLCLALFASALAVKADEIVTKWDVDVPAVAPAESAVQAARQPAFEVLASRSRTMEVLVDPRRGEQSEKKVVNATVQMVTDPHPQGSEIISGKATERAEPSAAGRDGLAGHAYIFVEATVFNRGCSHLKIYPQGRAEGAVEAWSNIDFNVFSGTGKMMVRQPGGRSEEVVLAIDLKNLDTIAAEQRAAFRGVPYQAPRVPELPDLSSRGAAFSLVAGGAEDAGMARLEQLHDLYRKGCAKLLEAQAAMIAADEARQARLSARPFDQPQQVKISFWKKGGSPDQSKAPKGNGQ